MSKRGTRWNALLFASVVFLVAVTAMAVWSQFWVLAAIPIGFLFGFFLQKGDLCGSSAFSEVLVMKDRMGSRVERVGFAWERGSTLAPLPPLSAGSALTPLPPRNARFVV